MIPNSLYLSQCLSEIPKISGTHNSIIDNILEPSCMIMKDILIISSSFNKARINPFSSEKNYTSYGRTRINQSAYRPMISSATNKSIKPYDKKSHPKTIKKIIVPQPAVSHDNKINSV
ncbi:hypothetical protein RCL_jg28152.t1 [Rhizophagus clarus]|uniref:Uncharacterized protein n=1 Tax=Rhizophagus clarus TaxID=94130 RepID=A0A8H3LX64_9GLOM|nr:hypothetical protein RCL_jg28152.t1 [Rhizophagus clarus]